MYVLVLLYTLILTCMRSRKSLLNAWLMHRVQIPTWALSTSPCRACVVCCALLIDRHVAHVIGLLLMIRPRRGWMMLRRCRFRIRLILKVLIGRILLRLTLLRVILMADLRVRITRWLRRVRNWKLRKLRVSCTLRVKAPRPVCLKVARSLRRYGSTRGPCLKTTLVSLLRSLFARISGSALLTLSARRSRPAE